MADSPARRAWNCTVEGLECRATIAMGMEASRQTGLLRRFAVTSPRWVDRFSFIAR